MLVLDKQLLGVFVWQNVCQRVWWRRAVVFTRTDEVIGWMTGELLLHPKVFHDPCSTYDSFSMCVCVCLCFQAVWGLCKSVFGFYSHAWLCVHIHHHRAICVLFPHQHNASRIIFHNISDPWPSRSCPPPPCYTSRIETRHQSAQSCPETAGSPFVYGPPPWSLTQEIIHHIPHSINSCFVVRVQQRRVIVLCFLVFNGNIITNFTSWAWSK